MRNSVKLYFHYVSIIIRSLMQYKTSFILTTLGQFLVSFSGFLSMYFLFDRFHQLNGYSFQEILLCFAIVLMEYSLAEMVARGFDSFSGMVRNAEFDRVLLRPRSPVLQVLGSKFELTRIGRLFQALCMFVYAIVACGVKWDCLKILTIVFMLFGGCVLFAAIFMIYAALCFFTLEGLEFMNVFTDGAREFGKYPLEIYGRRMLLLTTFIIPYALVQYYPLLYVFGRVDSVFYVIVPLLACLFLIPGYVLWRIGVRHYKSSGS